MDIDIGRYDNRYKREAKILCFVKIKTKREEASEEEQDLEERDGKNEQKREKGHENKEGDLLSEI